MLRIGFPVVLLVCLLGAVIFSPQTDSTLWNQTLHNFAHGPIFGSVALVVLASLRRLARFAMQPPAGQYLASFGIAVLLGLLTEIVQQYTGRDASIGDLITDALGAAAFLLVYGYFDRVFRQRVNARSLLLLSGIAALVLLSWPLVVAARAYADRARGFPLIADFTQRVGMPFISAHNARTEVVSVPEPWAAAQDERALRIELVGTDWPGIEITEPYPDWTRHHYLALELVNPHPFVLSISMRIDDRKHNYEFEDRYNARFELPPQQRTTIRIPLEEIEKAPRGRSLDLRNVARILIFRREALSGETLYLTRAKLE